VNDERYARFPDEIRAWGTTGSFIAGSMWRPGIHVIELMDGSHLDVLIRGDVNKYPVSRALPVFFNGAIDRSRGTPPFFSGSTLAAEVGAPVIAIADPTISPENNLGIGWYTGLPASRAQDAIVDILEAMSRMLPQPPVFAGGSGGGFAALYYARRTESSAFVWNPQVDLLRYAPAYVRPYLSAALDDDTWEAAVTERLRDTPAIDYCRAAEELTSQNIDYLIHDTWQIARLLYLQNATDNHENRHARPLRERDGFSSLGGGVYQAGSRVMAVGDFADSHRAPSRDVIRDGLAAVMDPSADLAATAADLLARVSRASS
jgi:hypothetical protein